jgi:hypothetical protein
MKLDVAMGNASFQYRDAEEFLAFYIGQAFHPSNPLDEES